MNGQSFVLIATAPFIQRLPDCLLHFGQNMQFMHKIYTKEKADKGDFLYHLLPELS